MIKKYVGIVRNELSWERLGGIKVKNSFFTKVFRFYLISEIIQQATWEVIKE